MRRDKFEERIYGILRRYQMGEIEGNVRVGFLDPGLSAVLIEIKSALDDNIKRNTRDRVAAGLAV